MLNALLLTLLAHSTTPVDAAPRVAFEHAGFVHDAHLALPERERLEFHCRIDWPISTSRHSFVVEVRDERGNVLLERTVRACVEPQRARHKRARLAQFTLSDARLSQAADVRVRVAP